MFLCLLSKLKAQFISPIPQGIKAQSRYCLLVRDLILAQYNVRSTLLYPLNMHLFNKGDSTVPDRNSQFKDTSNLLDINIYKILHLGPKELGFEWLANPEPQTLPSNRKLPI